MAKNQKDNKQQQLGAALRRNLRRRKEQTHLIKENSKPSL
ncbi:hypothetical protein Zymop_0245 [Zymomonas mobilis subsp. pomaceae ATCC 29192]|uniref:Uncharacterized protein n=1 Tax=Zymomonas mobilis subsp. pomaceae (strain ATCC 29192 / DSM 22645 / JCM 10191 / CCUG 17912 / NBRC 13757 / NCIMB 11200 / NRRL B-4491 / Barker I) TaxID=579138 RepID=F8EU68_ZYMMT|nr:hypothetical protein Zymop_0245 [Zymomonas mobilis subsp. pomaceae ATCC 29192]